MAHEAARPATAGDVPVVAQLVRAAVDELRPQRGGEVWFRQLGRHEPVEEGLTRALDAPDHLVVVGTVDEVVVGYGVVRSEVLRDGSRLGVIDDLYTDPAARAIGVGEAMMALLTEWCREHGCLGIDALALPGNRDTKNFFETFGLVARAIVVHRSLDEPGS